MTLLEAEMCALIARNDGVTGSELSEELAVTQLCDIPDHLETQG